jgi:predicted transport protein
MLFDKTYEERHLSIASPTTKALYAKLKQAVLDIADDIQPYTSEKKYVGFHVGGRRIAIFTIHRDHVYIWLHLKPGELTGKEEARKYTTHCSLHVTPESNLTDVTSLIRQSYMKNKKLARVPSR